MRLIARIPAAVAAWNRIRNGENSSAGQRFVARRQFPLAVDRAKPGESVARDFDLCLVLHADHTFNASTFACREVVSTNAHIYAGVAAGVGALSGSLHGGANERVMKMLLQLEAELSSVRMSVPGSETRSKAAGK